MPVGWSKWDFCSSQPHPPSNKLNENFDTNLPVHFAYGCAGFFGNGHRVVSHARQRRFNIANFSQRRIHDFALSVVHPRNEHARADAGTRIGQHIQPPNRLIESKTPRVLSDATISSSTRPERVQRH